MADINEVNGVFGGVEFGANEGATAQEGANASVYGGQEYGTQEQATGANLPVKTGFWNSFKTILFKEIKVELTPRQQKIENEINEFLHQEITWEKVHDFLFQEIKFGKKTNV